MSQESREIVPEFTGEEFRVIQNGQPDAPEVIALLAAKGLEVSDEDKVVSVNIDGVPRKIQLSRKDLGTTID